MQSRSSAIDVESSGDKASVYCKQGVGRASDLGRGKKNKGAAGAPGTAGGKPPKKSKKTKGGGGGGSVNCANLALDSLAPLIADLKIGGFIRIKNSAGEVSNVPAGSIGSLTLANNNLSDGEELTQFLGYLPSLSTLTLANNKFTELPSNTLHGNPRLVAVNLKENQMTSFPERFFEKQKLSKKSDLKFSCTMKYIPIDILINDPKMAKSFIAAAEFC